MRLLILLGLFMTFNNLECEKVSYDNYKLFKVIPKSLEAVKVLHELEMSGTSDFSFWNSVGPMESPVNIMVSPKNIHNWNNLVDGLDADIKLIVENVQNEINIQQLRQTRNDDFGWTRYHTLDEINLWLRNLSVIFAPNVTLLEAGRSYEGRTIYGIKISYSPDNYNNTVFLESGMHANEWITSAVSTYIVNELLTSNDSSVRHVAESHDWYFVPIFNPDGFIYSHTTDRLWRKTRVLHSILCTGADPNRNWGHFWNYGGTSNSPCSEIYRGPQSFSEPCVRSLSEFISGISERLVAYISFHSYMQLLLIPYGYTGELLDNYDKMYEIGLKSIEALARRYGTNYTVGNIYSTIYPASGTSSDWVKGTFKTPIVYTYELRDRGDYGFLLPPEQILPTALETLDSFITIFVEYEKLEGNSSNNQ